MKKILYTIRLSLFVLMLFPLNVFATKTLEWTEDTKDFFSKTQKIEEGVQTKVEIKAKATANDDFKVWCMEGCQDTTISGGIVQYDNDMEVLSIVFLKTISKGEYTAKFRLMDLDENTNYIDQVLHYEIIAKNSGSAGNGSSGSSSTTTSAISCSALANFKKISGGMSQLDANIKNENNCNKHSHCMWIKGPNKCTEITDKTDCTLFTQKNKCTNNITNCEYDDTKKECKEKVVASSGGSNSSSTPSTPQINASEAVEAYLKDKYQKPENYHGPIPDCAWSGSCRNIGSLVEVGIRIGDMIFRYVAGIAFVFFIYGGFTMMMSFGNADKTKKGQQILVAAVVGLIIVFSAYLLIDFLLDALQVKDSFRGVNL